MASIYSLDPMVHKAKIAFMVIYSISVDVINSDSGWDMPHKDVMEIMLDGTTNNSCCIAIGAAPSM